MRIIKPKITINFTKYSNGTKMKSTIHKIKKLLMQSVTISQWTMSITTKTLKRTPYKII